MNYRSDMKNYSKANLGRAFEEQVERSNLMYRRRGLAVVEKLHTEVAVKRKGKELVEAQFISKAAVDFVGIANGTAVAFDAKSTKDASKFPLNNIAEHQLQFMRDFQQQGGISFLVIHVEKKFTTYLLTLEALEQFQRENTRKSIPFEYLAQHGTVIQCANLIECDWLSALEAKIGI